MEFLHTTKGKVVAGLAGAAVVGTVIALAMKKPSAPGAVLPSAPPMKATPTTYTVDPTQWTSFVVRTSFLQSDPNAFQSLASTLQTLGFASVQIAPVPSDPSLWAVSGQWQGSPATSFSDDPPLWIVVPNSIASSATQPLQPKAIAVNPNDNLDMVVQATWAPSDANALAYMKKMLALSGFDPASVTSNPAATQPSDPKTQGYLYEVNATYVGASAVAHDWPPVLVIASFNNNGPTKSA